MSSSLTESTYICDMDDKTYYGSLAETRVIYELSKKGYHIFNQISGKAPFDIVIYKDGVMKRVSIKCCNKKGNTAGTYQIEIGRVRSNKTSNTIYKFDKDECDILAIYVVEIDEVFYLDPITIHNKRQVFLNRRIAQTGL